MKEIRIFLESSSIAGLNHIATSTKYGKLFWIFAVVSGFIGAGYLINMSFQSWSLSPVTTTVETLPLSRITLPKVTVCPPRNTFTDLNYDLMKAEDLKLDEAQKNQLFEMALELLESKNFEKNWKMWNAFTEKDRFLNWYHGLTVIRPPSYAEYKNTLNFFAYTAAPNGVVTSQYFGEPFQLSKLEKNIQFHCQILTSQSIDPYDANLTLHVKFEQTPGFNHSIKDEEGNKIKFDSNNEIAYSPIWFDYYFTIERNIEDKELEEMNLLLIPGFRLSWYITGAEVTPEPPENALPRMKIFIRFIKTLEVSKLDSESAWKFVKKARTSYFLKTNAKQMSCSSYSNPEEELVTIFSNFVMPGSNVTEEILDVKEDVLKSRGEMFIYLITCPTEESKLFKRIFQQPVTGIFISMKKIVEKSSNQDVVDVGKKVLNALTSALEFQYVTNIDNSTIMKTKNLTNVEDIKLLSRVSNHPVHMIDRNGSLSPSAFIPFCSFGGDFYSMGTNYSKFKVPVCNSFQATVKDEQICYEIDLEQYRNEHDLVKKLQEGLVLYLDYNEDKQLTLEKNKGSEAHVYMDTINNLVLVGEFEFALKIFKEISVTESFMGLSDNDRGCQNVEIQKNCTLQKYVQTKSNCGCLPLHLALKDHDSVCKEPEETKCYQQILNGTFPNCMRSSSCSGVIITSEWEYEAEEDFITKSPISKVLGKYKKYKKIDDFSKDFKDYQLDAKLRYIRIYFTRTPYYDKIIKDTSAKFVDMLSAIGGTMGLLTGFSIISAVEIIYFALKIVYQFAFKPHK